MAPAGSALLSEGTVVKQTFNYLTIIGSRVTVDLDTRSLVNDRTKSLRPATVISAGQLMDAPSKSEGWRGENPVLQIRFRLDDGREYDGTDCDIFGFIVPVPV
jgi:hypothetical protein